MIRENVPRYLPPEAPCPDSCHTFNDRKFSSLRLHRTSNPPPYLNVSSAIPSLTILTLTRRYPWPSFAFSFTRDPLIYNSPPPSSSSPAIASLSSPPPSLSVTFFWLRGFQCGRDRVASFKTARSSGFHSMASPPPLTSTGIPSTPLFWFLRVLPTRSILNNECLRTACRFPSLFSATPTSDPPSPF